MDRFAAFCNGLGVDLLRSALIWRSFLQRSATVWGSICCILEGFGGRFAVFCIDLGSFCCVPHRSGVVLLRSASIWGSFCCVLQRSGGRFVAFCVDLGILLLRSATV